MILFPFKCTCNPTLLHTFFKSFTESLSKGYHHENNVAAVVGYFKYTFQGKQYHLGTGLRNTSGPPPPSTNMVIPQGIALT